MTYAKDNSWRLHPVFYVVVGSLLLFGVITILDPGQNDSALATNQERWITEARNVVASGNGHDYIDASPAVKAAIAVVISDRVGGDSAYHSGVLGSFYYKAKDESPALLSIPIRDVAAAGRVMLDNGK